MISRRIDSSRAFLRAVATIALLSSPGTVLGAEFSEVFEFSAAHPPGSRFMDVRLAGTVRLNAGADGRPHQLSGLAWDADEQLLYALSDDAYLVHLRPHINAGILSAVSLIAIHALRDADGAPLSGRFADSEGLYARRQRNRTRGDTELVVSFEGVPRLASFTSGGEFVATIALPADLADARRYAGANRQLEALTGVTGAGLIVAPERPLHGGTQRYIPIYSTAGRRWDYPPSDAAHSAIVGFETTQHGELLILERTYASLLQPMIIAVRRTTLDVPSGRLLAIHDVARFSTAEGWALDNFEGLARHQGHCYFMVSDDNRRAFQRTLLTYFEILSERGEDAAALSARADAASVQPGCRAGFESRVDER